MSVIIIDKYFSIGQCCGPFKKTYGALYGKGSQLCGTYMYSETIAAGALYYFDEQTKTAIAYMNVDSSDGWTKAGTWFTYNDKNSITAINDYISKLLRKITAIMNFFTIQIKIN